MSSSSAVTKQPAKDVSQPAQQGMMESKEASASVSANAGLNLNLFGAISGAFSGKSKKETAPDGSSVEQREEQAHVKGAGAGNLNVQAAAQAEEHSRQMRAAIKQGES